MPKNLIDFKKRGFSVPIEKWMQNQLREDITLHLIDKPIFGGDHIQQNILREQVLDFFDNKKVNAWGLWHMYVWQKWAVQNNLI